MGYWGITSKRWASLCQYNAIYILLLNNLLSYILPWPLLLFASKLTHELLGLLRLAPPSGKFKLKLAVESRVHCTYYWDTTPYGVLIDGRRVGRKW